MGAPLLQRGNKDTLVRVVPMQELAQFDAIGLADQMRRGKLSASEALEACVAAIEQLNPRLNAVICKLYAEARHQLAAFNPESPFCGVPFLAKDLIAEIAGTPLHEGSAFLRNHYRSREDSELVTCWREAGLLLVGKTQSIPVRPYSRTSRSGYTWSSQKSKPF